MGDFPHMALSLASPSPRDIPIPRGLAAWAKAPPATVLRIPWHFVTTDLARLKPPLRSPPSWCPPLSVTRALVACAKDDRGFDSEGALVSRLADELGVEPPALPLASVDQPPAQPWWTQPGTTGLLSG